MTTQEPPPGTSTQRELKTLLRAQTAGAVTLASMYAQWAGIAARFVERGAGHVAALTDESKPRFPDSYERVAARMLDDYARSVREAAALPQTGALRFARELQKQRRDVD